MKERLVELIKRVTLSTWTFSDLADYIIADGWIRPPCKVGDRIYKPWKAGGRNVVAEFVVIAIISAIKDVWSIKYKKIGGTICYQADINDFGKTVFLTREEAEAKLKESESE